MRRVILCVAGWKNQSSHLSLGRGHPSPYLGSNIGISLQRQLVSASHLRTFCNDLGLVEYSDKPIITSLDDPLENSSLVGFSHWLNPLSLETWVESHI